MSSVVGSSDVNVTVEQAGAQVQARVDVDIHAERGRGIDPRAVRGQARRHVDDVTAEPDRAELERAPVEVRAELLGDDDVVGRDLGGLLVGEFDRVGERTAGGKESGRAVAGGAEEVVGVVGGLVVGAATDARDRRNGGRARGIGLIGIGDEIHEQERPGRRSFRIFVTRKQVPGVNDQSPASRLGFAVGVVAGPR